MLGHRHVGVHMEARHQLAGLSSLHHELGIGGQTQTVRLGGKSLCLLSHLASPHCFCFEGSNQQTHRACSWSLLLRIWLDWLKNKAPLSWAIYLGNLSSRAGFSWLGKHWCLLLAMEDRAASLSGTSTQLGCWQERLNFAQAVGGEALCAWPAVQLGANNAFN